MSHTRPLVEAGGGPWRWRGARQGRRSAGSQPHTCDAGREPGLHDKLNEGHGLADVTGAIVDYDNVVVGSGFGGAVAACRLAQAGQSVLVLERGRRWNPMTYPSVTGQDWIFDVDEPERQNGWMDIRWFSDMIVVQGAGVGGGSLIYANVSVPPPPSTFESGWPAAIDAHELKPYVEKVGEMLQVSSIPRLQRTDRWGFVKRGARKLGHADRFGSLPLAVQFDEDYEPRALDDPQDERHAAERVNSFRVRQRTCIHLGECDIGCRVQAKNTLDLNYLELATQHGAEIRPLHLVKRLEPYAPGWRVHYDVLVDGARRAATVSARRVVLAAGSLGSTEIMFRSRLPGVSARLGHGWSANGDFLTPAVSDTDANPTVGPTISACIDHTDGVVYGEHIFIQDGGMPNLIHTIIKAWQDRLPRRWRLWMQPLLDCVADSERLERIMPWFAQGIDASDGRLRMRHSRLSLDWDIARSKSTIEAIIKAHKDLAKATGGKPVVMPTWKFSRKLVTPHPLGGCNMGDTKFHGVVDHTGCVFGQEGLCIADGSIVPRAIGRNPSRTIAALAERAVEHWLAIPSTPQ